MNRRISFSGVSSGNPLINALMVAGGVLALVALLVFSILAFLVIACIITVLAGIIGIRLWWRRRKLARRAEQRQEPGTTGSVIEGEYRRVPSRRDERP